MGGTPANISISFLSSKVEVICGTNLTMLIKMAQCRKTDTLAKAAKIVKDYGQRHIFLAGETLSGSSKTSS